MEQELTDHGSNLIFQLTVIIVSNKWLIISDWSTVSINLKQESRKSSVIETH